MKLLHKPFPMSVRPDVPKGGEHVDQVETPKPAASQSGRAVQRVLPRVLDRTASRGRRARRLRRKLRPAAYAYTDIGGALFEQPTRENFVAFNTVGYHVTVLMDRLMVRALAQTAEMLDDEVATGLAVYLDRHLIEEAHHAEVGGLTLEDMGTIGVDPDTIRNSPCPTEIDGLRESMFERLAKHPVAVLGFLQLEQLHSTVEGVDAMIEATGLPRSAFRSTELHAHLDRGHASELDRMMDTLALERWHERLIYKSAVLSIAAVRSASLAIFERPRR